MKAIIRISVLVGGGFVAGCVTTTLCYSHFFETVPAGAKGSTSHVQGMAADEPRRISNSIAYQDIRTKYIGKQTQLIGELGYPLGEVTTIQGKWALPQGSRKDDESLFSVSLVNGKHVDVQISLRGILLHPLGDRVGRVIPQEGAEWELRGFEEGRYFGLPNGVYEQAFQSKPQMMNIGDYGFYCTFSYFSARELK